MSTSLRKPRWLGRGALALLVGAAFLASAPMAARAGTGLPGSALWGYYDISEPSGGGEFGTGNGDSILRLINPTGNANFSFAKVVDQCAMIYVFDDDQEMGECCGCPITPTQLTTFSFEHNLISNWALAGEDTGNGAIAIRTAFVNNTRCDSFALPGEKSPACNGGCDPSVGFNGNPNLLGSITHVQRIYPIPSGVTEVSLFDDGAGDPNNNTYLIQQCAALVGNGTGGGICNCPVE